MNKLSYEREREKEDKERFHRTGVESYEQKLERWKDGWRQEINDDLAHGR